MPVTRITSVVIVAASVAAIVPAATAVGASKTARQRATAQCKAERKRLGAHPFHQKYGVHSEAGALRACVNKRLRHAKAT
jgi:hypothetical protein